MHINILHSHHRKGIGKQLMSLFEDALISRGIRGVYLETSNHNTLAIPFYKSLGYTILLEKKESMWRDVLDYRKIVFGKQL